MVTRKRKKSKSKKRSSPRTTSKSPVRGKAFKKRSRAAKQGWKTRRRNALIASRKIIAETKISSLGKKIERLKKELDESRDEIEKERITAKIKAEAEKADIPQFPAPPRMPRNQTIKTFMDQAYRIYSKGPGLLDTAYELAEYYEISVDEVFDIWYL